MTSPRFPLVYVTQDSFIFKSPQRFSVVRCHTEPNVIRLKFPIPVSPVTLANPEDYPEGFERIQTMSLSLRGPFSNRGVWRNQFVGAVYRLLRSLLSSLLNSVQEPSGGLPNRFEMFLRCVAHDEQLTTEPRVCRTQTKGILNP